MEASIWLAGTIQGETKFTGQPMMKATVTGAPRFKFIDILGQDQLKAYAAKPRADLESQLGRLLKKEEDAAGEAAVDQALQQQHPVEHAIKHIPKCKDIKGLIRKCGEKPSGNERENLAAQLQQLARRQAKTRKTRQRSVSTCAGATAVAPSSTEAWRRKTIEASSRGTKKQVSQQDIEASN